MVDSQNSQNIISKKLVEAMDLTTQQHLKLIRLAELKKDQKSGSLKFARSLCPLENMIKMKLVMMLWTWMFVMCF